MSTKENLLMQLENNRGKALSGEALAKALNVSRAAVWKAMQELQKDGHIINAVPRKGYTLQQQSDVLCKEGILPYLNNKDVEIIAKESVTSTNILAKEIAAQGAKHGSLVVATQQTNGRGRRGRSFVSPKDDGIYLSIVLRSELPMADGALITSAAAVAVCRALEKVCKINDVQIKWVNDLYTKGKKCCGILCEAAADLETGGVDYIVVGIGINLFMPKDGYPEEIKNIATAIFESEENISRCQLVGEITNELLALCKNLSPSDFMQEYRSRNLVLGKEITIIQNSNERLATATAITDEGHLIVKLQNGVEETLSFGEVSLRI